MTSFYLNCRSFLPPTTEHKFHVHKDIFSGIFNINFYFRVSHILLLLLRCEVYLLHYCRNNKGGVSFSSTPFLNCGWFFTPYFRMCECYHTCTLHVSNNLHSASNIHAFEVSKKFQLVHVLIIQFSIVVYRRLLKK